jgi:hypothetical protein
MDAAVRLVSCRKSQTLAVLMRGLEQEEDWNRKRTGTGRGLEQEEGARTRSLVTGSEARLLNAGR